ncbi:cytochrome P450 3A24-like isoform X1 [Haemaphysalis longicornis]
MIGSLTVLLSALLLSLWYTWRRRRFSLFERLGIPGPTPSFILGNIYEIKKKGAARAFSDWIEQYGNIVGFFNGAAPFLLVKDVELLKKVLIEDFHVFQDRGSVLSVLPAPVHPDALLFTAPGSRFKSLRRTVGPAFTASKLSQAYRVFQTSSDTMADSIAKISSSGRPVNVMLMMRRYALEATMKAGFGIDMGVLTAPTGGPLDLLTEAAVCLLQSLGLDGIALVANCVPELQWLWLWLVTMTGWLSDSFVVMLQAFMKPIVEQRRHNISGKQADLLQLLLDKEDVGGSNKRQGDLRLSPREVLINACVYLFAGLDGTAHAIAAALYLLAQHPDIQKRLREHVRATSGTTGNLSFDAIGQLKYLDMVLKESMRVYYQNVSFITRRAVVDYEYNGIRIPKGVSVLAATSCMNQDPEIWSNPSLFDPERFNEDNRNNIHPACFLPFGNGPRACVGRPFAFLNVKVALATLVSMFTIHVDEERHKEPIKLQSGFLTTRLPNSMWLKFENIFGDQELKAEKPT